MKKLALSVAVAAIAATGVQAKTVYEDDAMSLSLTGEVAFEVIRKTGEDEKFNNKTDNVDLEAKAVYSLENGVDVFGYYAFEFAGWTENQSSAKDLLKDHYVGMIKDGLEVRYGDQDYAIDDFGIGGDLDADTARDVVMNQDDSENGGSAEVLVVEYSGDMFYVAASVDVMFDDEDTSDEASYDIFAEFDVVDDVTVGVGYSYQDYVVSAGETEGYSSYGVQVEFSGVDNLTLGASYVFGEYYDDGAEDASGIDLLAKYKVNSKVKVAAGLGYVMPDDSDEETGYFVNGNYNFTKNVDAYAEVYGYDVDDTQLGFVAGLSIDF